MTDIFEGKTKADLTDKENPFFLTVKETAAFLRCHPKTIVNLIKKRQLRNCSYIGRWLIPRKSVEQLLKGGQ